MHDLVVRGGTVIDGTGSRRQTMDIAIDNGIITELGRWGRGIEKLMPTDLSLLSTLLMFIHIMMPR